MPYGAKSRFHHQEIRSVPAGYHVRTVRAGSHQVRVAFPPGPRRTGAGIVVGILHPRGENPCNYAQMNPAELVLMGANPGGRARRRNASPYDALDVKEKLAFGRLGLGKKQLKSQADIEKARRQVRDCEALRNRLPNPTQVELAAGQSLAEREARELREGFSGEESRRYRVYDEPHMPAGDYADCGEFIAIAVKPTESGSASGAQEIAFPGVPLRLVANSAGDQLYVVGGDQRLSDEEVKLFANSDPDVDTIELGEGRAISYGMIKFGSEVPVNSRGEDIRWDHAFGDEKGGTKPRVLYDRTARRLLIGKASYHVEGAWIRN